MMKALILLLCCTFILFGCKKEPGEPGKATGTTETIPATDTRGLNRDSGVSTRGIDLPATTKALETTNTLGTMEKPDPDMAEPETTPTGDKK